MGCYIWYSEEGPGRDRSPPTPLLAVSNVTAHTSTASLSITVLLYNGPLLCGFNVPVKELKPFSKLITSQFVIDRPLSSITARLVICRLRD